MMTKKNKSPIGPVLACQISSNKIAFSRLMQPFVVHFDRMRRQF